jgi:hypothetical protein
MTRSVGKKTARSKTQKVSPKSSVFSKSDMKSGDGMLTTVWGPSLWHVLHTMSFNYPNNPTEEDKQHYKSFIESLVHVLPCKYCRDNLVKNFKKVKLKYSDMKSRYTFSYYIYRLHEHVNKMLKKTSGLTYADVRERYEHFRARCTLDDPKVKTEGKGCTEPLYGKKAKGVIHIIPQDVKCETIQINPECIKSRVCTVAP